MMAMIAGFLLFLEFGRADVGRPPDKVHRELSYKAALTRHYKRTNTGVTAGDSRAANCVLQKQVLLFLFPDAAISMVNLFAFCAIAENYNPIEIVAYCPRWYSVDPPWGKWRAGVGGTPSRRTGWQDTAGRTWITAWSAHHMMSGLRFITKDNLFKKYLLLILQRLSLLKQNLHSSTIVINNANAFICSAGRLLHSFTFPHWCCF